MRVITVSRQLGSHGSEIAVGVAQALGLRLIDVETINRAAQQAGVPEIALAEMEQEGARGLANQVLKAMRAMPGLNGLSAPAVAPPQEGEMAAAESSGLTIPFAGLFSPTVRPLSASLDSYVRMVDLVIRGLAREGNVLIAGRGGQVLLRKLPGVLHVQTVAPRAYRVEVVAAQYQLDKRAAQRKLRASDRARADYLRRYHGVDWLDPMLYHLVINTGRVPVATAIQLIIAAHEAMATAAEGSKDG